MTRKGTFFGLLFLCQMGFLLLWGGTYEPPVVYLTWLRQPESTMSIQWITEVDHEREDSVSFQEVGLSLSGWHLALGYHYLLPGEKKYVLHRVELTDLEPDTDYRFKIGIEGKEFKFRTMQKFLDKPVRFVVGGDMYHDAFEYVSETNRQASKFDPDFALAGGDLAYAAGKLSFLPQSMDRWMVWLKGWKEQMVTSDGRLIPIVAAIGNHDTSGGYNQTPAQAGIFYLLFRGEEQQGYDVLDFGSYLSVVILDTGHTNPICKQAVWLAQVLDKREFIPHKFALYHVPAYPSCRNFKNKHSEAVRRFWVPIFDKYKLDMAFENHDHTYKRTHPLTNGKINATGVVYIGDGSWGIGKPRVPKKQPYILKSASARHFIGITLQANQRLIQGISSKGNILDELNQTVRGHHE